MSAKPVVYDPLHYLALLEQKTRALDQAAPLQGWQLPAVLFATAQVAGSKAEARQARVYTGAAPA